MIEVSGSTADGARLDRDVSHRDEGPGPGARSEFGGDVGEIAVRVDCVGDLYRVAERAHDLSLPDGDYGEPMAIQPVRFGSQSIEASDASRLLVDRAAIVDLTVRYTWALDSKNWDDLDNVFLAEATAFLTEELSGVAAIKERVTRALSHLDESQHIVANHQIVIDGDRASCRCYLQAQHVRRSAHGGPNFIVAGRYHDQLIRKAAGWRIARRELVIMWTEGNPAVARA